MGEPSGPDLVQAPDDRAANRLKESIRVDGYRVDHVLGMGGFGIVVAGTRIRDDTPVAIKTVHREDITARDRLVFEGQALAAIGPPHVPELYESGRLDDGRPYFVFERLTLPSLDSKLGTPMAPGKVLALATPILDAIEAAHRQGFLHRDIKPENIFVGGVPVVAKLIDFGLAKPLPEAEWSSVETAIGVILGTPTYMSPEQCEGRRDIDARADLYALGVVLYEMLTSTPPFRGEPGEVHRAHIGRAPAPPSRHVSVAPEVDAVILRCLAKEREQRFADIGELRAALTAALQLPAPLGVREPRADGRRELRESSPQVLVGVIFFEALSGTGEATRAISALGGTLVALTGKRCVVVFRADSDRDPLQRAIESARALIDQGIAIRVTVDRDRVRVVRGRQGTQRMVATNFHRTDRFASATAPKGTLLTARAAEFLVRDMTVEIPGQDELVQYLDHGTEPGKSDLHSEPLIGRKSTMRALIQGARLAADTRTPGIATVLAEPGYGKSHVCASLLTGLKRTDVGFRIIRVRAHPSGHALPALLYAALRLSDGVSAEIGHRVLIERLGVHLGEEVWPAVGLACGWLSPEAPEIANLNAAPGALRAASARAAGEALRKLASEQPVACLVDEAQFADDATLDALEYATLSEAGVPLWVCVLARPAFSELRPLWGSRCSQSYSILLGALPSANAARLLRRLLYPVREIPADITARLVGQTRGNPLFIAELASAIRRRGLVKRDPDTEIWFLDTDGLDDFFDVPGLEHLPELQIRELPADLAAHARLVAVLDDRFRLIEVDGALRELDAADDALDAWVGTRQLVSQGLLVARSQGLFEFRHALVRDQILSQIPGPERQRLHLAAYRYYCDTQDIAPERRAPLVALHAAGGGLSDMAAVLYLELAERAELRHDYREAIGHLTCAIELLSDSEWADRGFALRARGRMYIRQRRPDDARPDLLAARKLAESLGDDALRAELALDLAELLDEAGDTVNAQVLVEQAGELAPAASSTRTHLVAARLTLARGRVHDRGGDDKSAAGLFKDAAAQAARLGSRGHETQVAALRSLAAACARQGEISRASEVFKACVALCESRGDKHQLAAALSDRSALWAAQSDLDRAARDALRCYHLTRELGLLAAEYAAARDIARMYYATGELEAAQPHVRRAIELEPLVHERAAIRLLAARIAVLNDDLRRAKSHLHAGRADQHRALVRGHRPTDADEVVFSMVELAIEQAGVGEWRSLRRYADHVCSLDERIDLMDVMAISLWRSGYADAARSTLEQALRASAETPLLIAHRVSDHLAALNQAQARDQANVAE